MMSLKTDKTSLSDKLRSSQRTRTVKQVGDKITIEIPSRKRKLIRPPAITVSALSLCKDPVSSDADSGPTSAGEMSISPSRNKSPVTPKPNSQEIDSFSKRGTRSNRKLESICWICHSDGGEQGCTVCSRVFHNICIDSETYFLDNGTCPECSSSSIHGTDPPKNINVKDLSAALLLVMDKLLEKYPEFETCNWTPSKTKNLSCVMDFSTLRNNIKNAVYSSTTHFLGDVKRIHHNCCIVYDCESQLAKKAKTMTQICKNELIEAEACVDCYIKENDPDGTFIELCETQHELVWAKKKGFPFWPAKVLKVIGSIANVRFFGSHDKAKIPVDQCLCLSNKNPNSKVPKSAVFHVALTELTAYIQNMEQKYGPFSYSKPGLVFKPNNETSPKTAIKRKKLNRNSRFDSHLTEDSKESCMKQDSEESEEKCDPEQKKSKKSQNAQTLKNSDVNICKKKESGTSDDFTEKADKKVLRCKNTGGVSVVQIYSSEEDEGMDTDESVPRTNRKNIGSVQALSSENEENSDGQLSVNEDDEDMGKEETLCSEDEENVGDMLTLHAEPNNCISDKSTFLNKGKDNECTSKTVSSENELQRPFLVDNEDKQDLLKECDIDAQCTYVGKKQSAHLNVSCNVAKPTIFLQNSLHHVSNENENNGKIPLTENQMDAIIQTLTRKKALLVQNVKKSETKLTLLNEQIKEISEFKNRKMEASNNEADSEQEEEMFGPTSVNENEKMDPFSSFDIFEYVLELNTDTNGFDQEFQELKSAWMLLSPDPDPVLVEGLIRRGILSTAVKCLQKQNEPLLQYTATCVLAKMTSKICKHAQAVATSGAVPGLIAVLDPTNQKISMQAFLALRKIIVASPDLRLDFIECGIVARLLNFMDGVAVPDSLFEHVFFIVQKICSSDDPLVIKTIKTFLPFFPSYICCDNVKIVKSILITLSYLMGFGNEEIQLLFDSELIPNIVHFLSHEDGSVQVTALNLVGNITAGSEEHVKAVMDCNMLKYFPALFENPAHKDIPMEALFVLANLVGSDPEYYQAVMDADLITWILKYLKEGNIQEKRYAAWTVRNIIVDNSRNQVQYFIQKGIIPLLGELFSISDSFILKHTVSIIANICESLNNLLPSDTVDQLKDCGVLNHVKELQCHEDNEISELAREIETSFVM